SKAGRVFSCYMADDIKGMSMATAAPQNKIFMSSCFTQGRAFFLLQHAFVYKIYPYRSSRWHTLLTNVSKA
ncbi:hypothetical protein GOODEAATRI_010228, partial [Goodea atripinnis]